MNGSEIQMILYCFGGGGGAFAEEVQLLERMLFDLLLKVRVMLRVRLREILIFS